MKLACPPLSVVPYSVVQHSFSATTSLPAIGLPPPSTTVTTTGGGTAMVTLVHPGTEQLPGAPLV